ncbi:MAG: RNA-guided endonuclease IscB, partial [Lachnospiraceae bacterium]|nr:RNA-guided endonuclease IscB [Lachnospiraceae bacterium]
KAKVIRRCPFTIQLLYEPDACIKQPVEIGDDTGSVHDGLSGSTVYQDRDVEIYASQVEMRTDITGLLSTRREFRRARRNRKTRYRKARFLNRVKSKHKGWLPPSIENKIAAHERELLFICSILPVTKITIETASFDLQKLRADMEQLERPEGKDYQQGPQLGFWNAREYVLFRDGHQCQCCKGKSKDKRLNVHHIESRKTGGNAPNNLITLCETCHNAYHAGKITLPSNIKRKASFRDAVFMGIMRWTFYNRIKETLTAHGIEVHMTYGYITKNTRIRHGLEKTHCTDAMCISGHPDAEPLPYYYHKKKVRCHNRQLHKATIQKNGIRKANQAPKTVFGFRLFDKVLYQGIECFVFSRRSTGYFDLRMLDGTKVHASASYKKLKLLEHNNGTLTQLQKKGDGNSSAT